MYFTVHSYLLLKNAAKILEKLGEKPYKCKFCSVTFVRNYALKMHEQIHTGL